MTAATITVIGRGRLGSALAAALDAGEPQGRGSVGAGADIVLLCVPDEQIPAAAACVAGGDGVLVGHCSGATPLAPLAPHEAFSLHPLTSVTGAAGPAVLTGASCAIAGSTDRALAAARGLAERLGMRAFAIEDADRAAYHAAASMASNFLVTLEAAAERVLASAGAGRDLLVPLVRATVENWAALGPERALSGPIARGDEGTVARQRAAVQEHAPELLALFDALADATRTLAASPEPAGAGA